jgi:O-methyltransferase
VSPRYLWPLVARSKLLELSATLQATEGALTASESARSTLALEKEALLKRVTGLESHNALLTESATELATKLQAKEELDYQILMTHQQLLAGIIDLEPRFHELYERSKTFTMTSVERLYSVYKAVEYLAKANIPGDILECGVWRGGSCMLVALSLLLFGDRERRILLFDTFEGHPRPDLDKDIDLWGNKAVVDWDNSKSDGGSTDWGFASIEEVRANLATTGYPEAKLAFIKGKVEDTLAYNIPDRLALLRLDTDWYESTRVALAHLYPRLVPGGVLIVDDYGHYQGQRQAVDEYFWSTGQHLLLHRIDYSCRVGVKPA